MTLILTEINRQRVIQVADRLVTKGTRKHDPRANKSILFAARDALVTVAYSGVAHIRGEPTDEWIVETLWGTSLKRGRDGKTPVAITVRGSRKHVCGWPDIGQAVDRLIYGIQAAGTVPKNQEITIISAGWQLRKKRPRPFAVVIRKLRNETSVQEPEWTPRHMWSQDALLDVPDGYLSHDERSNLLKELCRAKVLEAEKTMVSTVRDVAARTATVGDHCLCTIITPLIALVRVRYDCLQSDIAEVGDNKIKYRIPVAYTPWLLTEKQVTAPSILHGLGMEVSIGNWRIRMEGTGAVSGRSREKSGLKLDSVIAPKKRSPS